MAPGSLPPDADHMNAVVIAVAVVFLITWVVVLAVACRIALRLTEERRSQEWTLERVVGKQMPRDTSGPRYGP